MALPRTPMASTDLLAGGLILDLFAGSVTTGISALAKGRRLLGFELDERIADEAQRRLGAWAVAHDGVHDDATSTATTMLTFRDTAWRPSAFGLGRL